MAGRTGLISLQKIRNFTIFHRNFTAGQIIYNKPSATASSGSSKGVDGNVPGLSANVVAVPSEPVGPGASKSTNYKNPEYFSYSNISYFEAEVEMLKYRCPQPSNKIPFKQL